MKLSVFSFILFALFAISSCEKGELWTAIKAWHEAHPDAEAKPVLQYSVEIVFEDGTTQAIANEEEMIEAKKSCWEDKENG